MNDAKTVLINRTSSSTYTYDVDVYFRSNQSRN